MTQINDIIQWLNNELKDDNDSLDIINSDLVIKRAPDKFTCPKLLEFSIKNYGLFNQKLKLKFNPNGLTLLIGSNTSGKSIIVDLLKFTLKGKHDRGLKSLDIAENRDLILNLTAEKDGVDYNIFREVSKYRKSKLRINPEGKISYFENEYFIKKKLFGIESTKTFTNVFEIMILCETPENFLLSNKVSGEDGDQFRIKLFNQLLAQPIINLLIERINDMISKDNTIKRNLEDSIHYLIAEKEKIENIPDIKKLQDKINGLKNKKNKINEILEYLYSRRNIYYDKLVEDNTSFEIYSRMTSNMRDLSAEIDRKRESKVIIQDDLIKVNENLRRNEWQIKYIKDILCSVCAKKAHELFKSNKCIKCEKVINKQKKSIVNFQTYKKELIKKLELIEDVIKSKQKELQEIDKRIESFLKAEHVKKKLFNNMRRRIRKKIELLEEKKRNVNSEIKKFRNLVVKKSNFNEDIINIKTQEREDVKKHTDKLKEIQEKLYKYNLDKRVKFFIEFNKKFTKFIEKISGRESVLDFGSRGLVPRLESIDFEGLSGMEKRIYDISFRLCLFIYLKNLGFNLSLIIENGELHLDSIIKKNLVDFLIEYCKEYQIPIIVTSCDEGFFKNFQNKINKNYIYNINSFTKHLLPQQKDKIKECLDPWLFSSIRQNVKS